MRREVLRKIAEGGTDAERLQFTEQLLRESKRQYAVLLAEYKQMREERGKLIDSYQSLYKKYLKLCEELGKEDEDVL